MGPILIQRNNITGSLLTINIYAMTHDLNSGGTRP